ncbi:MAG: hypothetical protein NVS3B29_07800 [Candidatus Saccharimonadales bacterium]
MNYRDATTYQIGLLQAQAYRNLQEVFRAALDPYELTIPEWSVLGITYDKNEIGMTELTELLRSKASHPTVLVETLRKRGFLVRVAAPDDKRAKLVRITPAGRAIVEAAEPEMRASMGAALAGIDRGDVQGYFTALLAFARLD